MNRILIPLVILLLVGIAVWKFAAPNSENAESGRPWPGPENIGALEIKGQRPDGATSWNAIDVPPSPPADAVRGKELFEKACAACHGNDGKGGGPLAKAYDLGTLPANLAKPLQSVKIRSTMSGSVPADSDLFRTITRGLPGTAMWSYRALSPSDRWALVHYLKSLAPENYKDTPEIVSIPARLESNPGLVEAGAAFYKNICQNCHGPQGLGGDPPIYDSETGKQFPGLAFSRHNGAFMLGGSSNDDIARTLMTGFHSRSPMRSFKPYLYPGDPLTPAQKSEGDRKLWGVIYYSRHLIDAQKR